MTDAPENWDNRTRRLLGDERADRLNQACILIVGVGGVGGYAAEMLARSGIGRLVIIDADNVAESNINRQLIATASTVGEPKVILFAERFHDINPRASIEARMEFVTPENVDSLFDGHTYDYVIDAIDTVAPKVALLEHCLLHNIPVISSMGAGGRVDPTKIGYFDLWDTREDGLAKAVSGKHREALLPFTHRGGGGQQTHLLRHTRHSSGHIRNLSRQPRDQSLDRGVKKPL